MVVRLNSMGIGLSTPSDFSKEFAKKAEEIVIRKQFEDIRQEKFTRDYLFATKIAATRDWYNSVPN